MTGEELCTKLYQRMTAEQEHYRNWLLGQPPGEILDHAAEYTVREDIVMAMEEFAVADFQAVMLTGAVGIAADVYQLMGVEPLAVGQQVKLLGLGDLFRNCVPSCTSA